LKPPPDDGAADAAPDAGAESGDTGSDREPSAEPAAEAAPEPTPDASLAESPDASPDAAADSGAAQTSDALPDGPASADDAPDVPPPASGTPWRALAISTGTSHACALLDNHQVKCWGDNTFAALGTGDHDDRGQDPAKMGNALPFVDLGTGRSAVAISAGHDTTCAILDTGGVKCWGDRLRSGTPAKPGDDPFVGDQPSELGDALPALDLGAGRKARFVAAGHDSTCAILDDGSVLCWDGGTPPYTPPTPLRAPAAVVQLVPAFGEVMALFADGSPSARLPLGGPELALLADQRAVYVGGSNTGACAVLSDGRLACGGYAASSAPLLATTDAAAVDVAEFHTCVLSKAGEVRCSEGDCGAYPSGTKYWCPAKPLVDGVSIVGLGQPATALGTGAIDFSCALLADGSVKCWTLYDYCRNAAGGTDPCAVTDLPLESVLGGGVTVTGTGANREYGSWRSIDLGTRP
jgi:hypothetical protein